MVLTAPSRPVLRRSVLGRPVLSRPVLSSARAGQDGTG